MRVIHAKLGSDFVQIPNAAARDHHVSWRARGLLAELLSYRDGYDITIDKLAAQAKRDGGKDVEGRNAMRTAMKELADSGYVHYRRYRNDENRFETEIVVYDVPCAPDDSHRRTKKPAVGNPVCREPGMSGTGYVEDPSVLKKTNKNTNKNTDNLKSGADGEEDLDQDQNLPPGPRFARWGPPEDLDDDWPEVRQPGQPLINGNGPWAS